MDFRSPSYPFLPPAEFEALAKSHLNLLQALTERMGEPECGLGPFQDWARIAGTSLSILLISAPPLAAQAAAEAVFDHIVQTVAHAPTLKYGKSMVAMLSRDAQMRILQMVRFGPYDDKTRKDVTDLILGQEASE
jgi:hypothetical protein